MDRDDKIILIISSMLIITGFIIILTTEQAPPSCMTSNIDIITLLKPLIGTFLIVAGIFNLVKLF